MANLTVGSSFKDLQEFLMFHIDSADDRPSVNNPSLTKGQVWNILFEGSMKASVRVQMILMERAIKEFGTYYESDKEAI